MGMKFTFYWLDGKRDVLQGEDAADALNSAGYGAGVLRALDFYATGDDKRYKWNGKAWVNKSLKVK